MSSKISVKQPQDLAKMRVAGRLAAEVLEMLDEHVRPGVTTGQLDEICHRHITEVQEAVPAPLNYKGFPRSICTSVNQVICHGIPNDRQRLRAGDIVNIDVTVIKDGFHGDTSKMFFVGKVSRHARRLSSVTQECLYRAIATVAPGATLGDIGHAVESHAKRNHYSVVRDFCGHGIGRGFHEPPLVLHHGNPGSGLKLVPGMTFTIEPMINAGAPKVRMLPDGWTAETVDGRLSAQWEHTLAFTDEGCEVLTARPGEPFYNPNGGRHMADASVLGL